MSLIEILRVNLGGSTNLSYLIRVYLKILLEILVNGSNLTTKGLNPLVRHSIPSLIDFNRKRPIRRMADSYQYLEL